MPTKPNDTPETRYALRKIEFLRAYSVVPSHTFTSFAQANEYLQNFIETLWEGDEESIRIQAEWEGGLRYNDTILVSSETKIHDGFLAETIQDELEGRMLYPGEGFLDRSIHQVSWQMERILCDRSDWETYDHLLKGGEGLDHEQFLMHQESLHEALQELEEEHPSLYPTIQQGKALFSMIAKLPNRTTFYRQSARERAKSFFCRAIEAIFQREEGRLQEAITEANLFAMRLQQDASILDERYTELGHKIYHLLPGDQETDLPSLIPMNENLVFQYQHRAYAVKRALPTDSRPEDLRLFFFAIYHDALYKEQRRKTGLPRQLAVSLATAKYLYKDGCDKETIATLLISCDPYLLGEPGRKAAEQLIKRLPRKSARA